MATAKGRGRGPAHALTEEERAEAVGRSVEARRRMAAAKDAIRRGDAALADVLEDPAVARMRVSDALRSLPGIGPARADRIMVELGIARSRRIRGLGCRQRAALARLGEELRPGA